MDTYLFFNIQQSKYANLTKMKNSAVIAIPGRSPIQVLPLPMLLNLISMLLINMYALPHTVVNELVCHLATRPNWDLTAGLHKGQGQNKR